MRKKWHMDDQAGASALLSFVIGTAVFSVTFYSVVDYSVNNERPNARLNSQDLEIEAVLLSDLIFRSPGVNWYGQQACAGGDLDRAGFQPDTLSKFGLAQEPCSTDAKAFGGQSTLSYDKIKAIREADLYESLSDAKANYESVYYSLALEKAGLHFNLEIEPVLPDLSEILNTGNKYPYIDALYIGDWKWSRGVCNGGWTSDRTVDKEIWKAANSVDKTAGSVDGDGADDEDNEEDGGDDDQMLEEPARYAHDNTLGEGNCVKQGWKTQQSADRESAYLGAILASFDRGVPAPGFSDGGIPELSSGDVLPDDPELLSERIPQLLLDDEGEPSLDRYNALVVGSNVYSEAMDDQKVRGTIYDWVAEGGYLIVFGSDKDLKWTEPFAHVKLGGSGLEAPDAPDITHDLLTLPFGLDWTNYNDRDRAWTFVSEPHEARFDHVVTSTKILDLDRRDYLALSNDGEFGDGLIALAAWQPWDLTGYSQEDDCSPGQLRENCESLRLLVNLIRILFRDLYVSFGPESPTSTTVATHGAIGVVHYERRKAWIDLDIKLRVWSTGPYKFEETVPPPDLQGPSQVQGLKADTDQARRTITVSWNEASDDRGEVVAYHRYRYASDSSLTDPESKRDTAESKGATSELSWVDNTAVVNTYYYYWLYAVDDAGNVGPWSAAAGATPIYYNPGGGGGGWGGDPCSGGGSDAVILGGGDKLAGAACTSTLVEK